MTKRIKISCIVPAHNEEENIEKVLTQVSTYPFFAEIIVINDASTDSTHKIIKSFVKGKSRFRYKNLAVNKGKSNAIKLGVKIAKGDLIVMIDADLQTLKHEHIDILIAPVLNGSYSMTMLAAGSDDSGILGPISFFASRPLSGQRAFWKEDFKKIDLKGSERYGVERVLNNEYLRLGLKINTIHIDELSAPTQFQKNKDLIAGLKKYTSMTKEILTTGSIHQYISNAVEIEDSDLMKLYDIKRKTKFKKLAFTTIVIAGLGYSFYRFIRLNSKKIGRLD